MVHSFCEYVRERERGGRGRERGGEGEGGGEREREGGGRRVGVGSEGGPHLQSVPHCPSAQSSSSVETLLCIE